VTNPSKVKGDVFERDQREHAKAAGIPTEKTKAGYARDAGDLHFYASPARPPLAIGQCKATPRSIDLAGFLRDAKSSARRPGQHSPRPSSNAAASPTPASSTPC
jgi:hypothetical protein